MKKVLVIIIFFFVSLFIFLYWQWNRSWVVIGGNKFFVEIAETDIERALGLMNRTVLPINHGMIFLFEDEAIRRFWMKNTFISLDMVFIDSDFRVVDIQSAVPCIQDPCQSYISQFPAQYVLEVPSGILDRGLVGEYIDFHWNK